MKKVFTMSAILKSEISSNFPIIDNDNIGKVMKESMRYYSVMKMLIANVINTEIHT